MRGLAVTEPPKDGANGGTGAGAEENDCPPGVIGYVAAVMGRTHPFGEFGFRSCQPTRPRGFPPEECDILNAASKKRILEAWAHEQALAATLSPAGSLSWEVAQKCARC